MKQTQPLQIKLHTLESLQTPLRKWREEGKRIVFTNGCFDIVHRGHVEYLWETAQLGDILIVGLNSDASIARLKGKHRPIIDEKSRGMLLAAFACVDAVVRFDEDTPYELIKEIRPDVLVKGGDYTEETLVGADIVRAKGGEVCASPLPPGYSTSLIEAKIKNQP